MIEELRRDNNQESDSEEIIQLDNPEVIDDPENYVPPEASLDVKP